MKGFPMMDSSALKKHDGTEHPPLQPSEAESTEITTGESADIENKEKKKKFVKSEKMGDIEDRISFIREDIKNQKGGATKQQRTDIANLTRALNKLKNQ